MDVLTLETVDPCVNLATEEYLLRDAERKEDILLLWRNHHTIVVGRHQLTLQEVDSEYVREQSITVVRRITGGGAVYHDMGNVNFSFITHAKDAARLTLERFTKPVAEVLKSMGLNAETTGRNDITVDGAKVSGNAQHLHRNRILHHGTLLFDANLSVLGKALKVHPAKLISKGIRSVQSRVTNILPCLPEPMTVEAFMTRVAEALASGNARHLILTEADHAAIRALADKKYRTHQWTVGHAPAATVSNARKFDGGLMEVRMDLVDGNIRNCSFFGDFMALRPAQEVSALLEGVPYRRESVAEVLHSADLPLYFGAISTDEVLECLFNLANPDTVQDDGPARG